MNPETAPAPADKTMFWASDGAEFSVTSEAFNF